MDNNKITLKINGKKYSIKGNSSVDHIFSAAMFVDRAIAEVTKMDATLSTEEAAVLAALNIASELLIRREKMGEAWNSEKEVFVALKEKSKY